MAENFADIAPRFTAHEAWVAADRCYFCYDAPCIAACPTAIDIPLFIRQIAGGQPEAAARTILSQNILGGMCARVCPTETLCEEACVREAAEGRPVEIGRLQRFATDALMGRGPQPFARAEATGKRVAVVGAGPAGLACAHRLAMLGHAVVLIDGREKGGGLNEFGIAAYKAVEGFRPGRGRLVARDRRDHRALRDAARTGRHARGAAGGVRRGLSRDRARRASMRSGAEGAGWRGSRPAVDFIAELRQAADLSRLPVGRRVVVIGGGMTAVDAGVQAKKLGAEEVTIVYRRGQARMKASGYEQELAAGAGVRILCNAMPVKVLGDGAVRAVEFAYTADGPEGLRETGETFTLHADQVLTAIGQRLDDTEGLVIVDHKIRVYRAGAHRRAGGLGWRRLRQRRRRPDGDRGGRGARRGDGHPCVADEPKDSET